MHGAKVCQPDTSGVPSTPNGATYDKAELSLFKHQGDLKQDSILKAPGKKFTKEKKDTLIAIEK